MRTASYDSTDRLSWTSASGAGCELPVFLPVYQPRETVFRLAVSQHAHAIAGIIVNAYFLYKQRPIRETLVRTGSLKEYIGFDGLIATDSGAFQGFTRQLFLSNKDIVRFQDAIGSDVIAPLDLVTPPGDNRTIAAKKLAATEKRIIEGLALVERGTLAGVQQGGRFMDLRHQSVVRLMELEVEYLAIGSLVPFFNVNHDLNFVGAVIRDARAAAGSDIPMHIYGAGDPSELPFMFAMGADIFDSSSYKQYANDGWYMTPFGALRDSGPITAGEYACACPICGGAAIGDVFADKDLLAQHNLNTILMTIERLRSLRRGLGLDAYLSELLDLHQRWFPDSLLRNSWLALHD
ncbi:MAG: tRNA-guanine transglycosylase [Hyphomicrobiales bacterium]|nr:tRNA-guanine transglycosylase [Hyphomicrobiales bacterium]